MSDIKLLEDRIRSLEYYTTLYLLEVNTENLFVTDSDGLNRFKSGFFVDDFTTLLPQETDAPIKNSIDDSNRELRPRHANAIDLTIEPVEEAPHKLILDSLHQMERTSNVLKMLSLLTMKKLLP